MDEHKDFLPSQETSQERETINELLKKRILDRLKRKPELQKLKETDKKFVKPVPGGEGPLVIDQKGFCPVCKSKNIMPFEKTSFADRVYKCLNCSKVFSSPTTYAYCTKKGEIYKDTIVNYCVDLCDIRHKENINIFSKEGCPYFGGRSYKKIPQERVALLGDLAKRKEFQFPMNVFKKDNLEGLK